MSLSESVCYCEWVHVHPTVCVHVRHVPDAGMSDLTQWLCMFWRVSHWVMQPVCVWLIVISLSVCLCLIMVVQASSPAGTGRHVLLSWCYGWKSNSGATHTCMMTAQPLISCFYEICCYWLYVCRPAHCVDRLHFYLSRSNCLCQDFSKVKPAWGGKCMQCTSHLQTSHILQSKNLNESVSQFALFAQIL